MLLMVARLIWSLSTVAKPAFSLEASLLREKLDLTLADDELLYLHAVMIIVSTGGMRCENFNP